MMKPVRNAIAVALLVSALLAGCDTTSRALSGLPPDEAAQLSAALTSPQKAHDLLAGSTAISVSADYGTQTEYLAADGSSELWFPGSNRTTPGHWKVEANPSGGVTMCFLYGANSYDPVLHTYGGDWECGPLARYFGHLWSVVKDDPFRLADGTPPFVMPPNEFDLPQQIQQKAGSSVSQRTLSYIFNRLPPT